MIPWSEIEGRAGEKLGSTKALEAQLPQVLSAEALAARPDSWFFSAMIRRIFQAGMQHRVINERWPAFEKYFWGFEPAKLMLLSEEQLEQAMQQPGLIRHWTKLRTIPVNAGVMADISKRHGGFGRWLVDWPDEDLVGLWRTLGKQFDRLGGMSGPRFLRLAGRDTFLLTDDVIQALQVYGVIDTKPTRKADLERINRQFVAWSGESRRPMAHISRILSHTVGTARV
jgi:3-methyladenine DNA glycosylase Tag